MLTHRQLAALISGIVILLALYFGGRWVIKAREAIAQNELRAQQAEATAGNIATVAEADATVVEDNTRTGQAAAAYHQSKQEEERNVPTARDRNARPVPDSVRERARARRLARERSASDERSR